MNQLGSGIYGSGNILIVGRTNVGASAYLERLLAARLIDTGISVRSAGTEALDGSPMQRSVVKRLRRSNVDATEFTARQLTAHMVTDADLILCTTREIRRRVVRLEPHGLHYTFAVLDFADLATRVLKANWAHAAPDTGDTSRVRAVVNAALTHRHEVHARLNHEADVLEPSWRSSRQIAAMSGQLDDAAAPITSVLTNMPQGRPTRMGERWSTAATGH